MKAYEKLVIWLNYFDSELKRREGRRLPMHSCVRAPTLEELTQATSALKLDPVPERATFPRSPKKPSGYVSVKRTGPKQQVIKEVARQLGIARGSKSARV